VLRMTHRARRALVVVTSLLAMAPCVASAETEQPISTAPVAGEDEALYRCKSRTAEVAVSFKPDMELKELMTWVVGFTCKNFILDPRVVATGKKVTVIAPNKMSATEAYRMFLVALSTMNLTVVPKGNVLRIADAGAARRDTVPMLRKGTPADDQVVRYIVRPKHAAADVLVQALATLKSEVGEVQQIGSMLMLTDYGGNVRDMLSLVKMVDLPKGSEGIYTIAIEHANAQVVAEKVGGILGVAKEVTAPSKAGGPAPLASTLTPAKVMVDERTNTIILAATDVAYERFRALAKRIDVPLDIEGGQSVHVYRLKNAIAEELAKTLNDTIGQTGPAAGATPSGAPKPPPAEGGVGTTIDGKVRVIADKPTNALIVLSTGRDFLALKEVITALDLGRPQVYIETMIVEVTVSNDLTTDGSVHGASALDKAAILGGVHTTNLNSAAPAPTAENPTGGVMSRGLVAGLLGPSMSVLGLTIPSYGVLFNALSHTSRTNVLSTPSMMALDNETAKFKVGKSIPLERTTQTNFGTQTNVEFRELNLELELKPHITSDDQILLEVKHAAEDEGDVSSFGVTLSNRKYETRVLVRDQQTIVIGGILQEKTKITKDSVPLLGDIPLLGRLFSYNSKEKRKSNTLILLTPYIVRNQFDLERIRLRKMQEHEEFVGSLKAFDGMKYTPKMDYARKRGLVEDINRAVEGVEQDKQMVEKMGKPFVIPSGPIELPAEE
jgi:general secretion pathway protein D